MQILQSLENKRITFWFHYLKNPKEESCLESNKGVWVFSKLDMILQCISYKN